MVSTPIPLPADLDAARVAAITLATYLTRTTGEFLAELQPDPAKLAPDRQQSQAAVANLDRLVADAEARVGPVRGVLAVASGRGHTTIDELLALARCIRDRLANLPPSGVPLAPHSVHNWLAGVSHRLDRYTADVAVYDSRFADRPEGIIHREMRQAAAILSVAPATPAERAAVPRGTPGRKRDSVKAEIVKRIGELRAAQTPWKAIPAMISSEFGRVYSEETLRRYHGSRSSGAK
jgi:hypothetical protein